MPPVVGGHQAMPRSVCLSICRSHLGQLCTLHHGQATRAVETADLSQHGRRSAAIDGEGGILSHRMITCSLSNKNFK